MNCKESQQCRLFIGVFPAGVVFADREREINGDYAKLAFLSFDDLKLIVKRSCPPELRVQIEAYAVLLGARRTPKVTAALGRADSPSHSRSTGVARA